MLTETRSRVVHVGYHKTGSTWLHRQVFPRATGYRSLGDEPLAKALMRNLMEASDGDFTASAFTAAIDAWTTSDGGVLLGNESLSGDVWRGSKDWARNAERLKQAIPDARILIVIRRQEEMLSSLYAQYVQEGGYASFVEFLQGLSPSCTFDAGHLRYDRLIRKYVDLFGPSSVCVLPFELLVGQPAGFLDELGAFLRVPLRNVDMTRQNPSLCAWSLQALRLWNRDFRRSKLNPSPRLVAVPGAVRVRRLLQRRVDPAVRRIPGAGTVPLASRRELDVLIPEYASSNAVTQRYVRSDLVSHGYALSESHAT